MKMLFFATLLLCLQCRAAGVLVLAPMNSELNGIIHVFQLKSPHHYDGVTYYKSEVSSKPVFFAEVGVGSINAAIVTTMLIQKFHPTLIIISGTAGGLQPKLKLGSIIVGTKIYSYQQYNPSSSSKQSVFYNAIRRKASPVIFKPSNTLLNLAKNAAQASQLKVFFGAIVTDQIFPDIPKLDKYFAKQGIYAIAMEDTAIAQTAWSFKIPVISIRAISDNIYGIKYTPGDVKEASIKAAYFVHYFLSNASHANKYPK